MTAANVDRTHRVHVSYIDKSREYYAAQGYETPYGWAYHDDAPFTPLTRPLAASRVGIVTTATLFDDDRPAGFAPRLPKRPYAMAVDAVPTRMYTSDLSWDKDATQTDDVETFLPLARLGEYVAEGRLGSLAPRFYGVPTEYSQRRTGIDANTLEEWCREDDVDVVLLVPL